MAGRARVQTLANLRGAAAYAFNQVAATWTSMPAATTEFLGVTTRRVVIDLSNRTQIRLCAFVGVAGATGATLGVQVSLDAGATWLFMNGDADGDLGSHQPQVAIDSAGVRLSAYLPIPLVARQANVVLRLVGDNGNGSTSPVFGFCAVEVT